MDAQGVRELLGRIRESELRVDVKELASRPLGEYLVVNRNYRVQETFADRDKRYDDVDRLLRGEFGYVLPGDNAVVEPPMVMNLGLAFMQDIARLTTEQSPVYKAPVYGDDKKDLTNAHLREVIAETYWEENRGDLTIPQQAIDLAVCGAAYTVCWIDPTKEYPRFARVDPRHAYPNIQGGELLDLLVIHVFPAELAEAKFPGQGIMGTVKAKNLKHEVEVWEFYRPGHASRWIAYLDKGGGVTSPNDLTFLDDVRYDDECMPAHMTQISTHDGAIRGMLDQLGHSLEAKNKIASLMTKYTEHKVFAPWEERGVLNPTDTPGPNTVYHHDPNAPNETFMRRVEPAGSDPALFALMNLMDLDQRGGIGYPASRQGEVGQSIASAAFVESTQGQLSSIVKDIQAHLADLRGEVTRTLFKFDVLYMDYRKPLIGSVDGKNTYSPSRDVKDRTRVRVQYGAGAGLSRTNADTRILNMLGARLIPRSVARDNIEFLKDRSDIQDRIEQENAEDALQQLFWPDPSVPIDIKFRVKKKMTDDGLNLADAWEAVQSELAAEQQAQAPVAAEAAPAPEVPGAPAPTAAEDQALALEKGQAVQEPADIALPPAPLEQIFIGG